MLMVARPLRGQRAVDQRGIAGERAVGTDQSVGRQWLAAVACDIDFAFGDQRGCEIEHDGRGALPGNANAERRRRQSALQSAERRDQNRTRSVDEMDRDQSSRRGALRPLADTADVAGIAQRDCGKAGRLRLLHANVDGHRRHRLTEAEAAVDDSNHRSVDKTFERLIGNEVAAAHPIDITRNTDNAVAVVACEIGVDERSGDAACFLRLTAGAGENVSAEVR
jgi:hypothetical protein